MKKYICDVCGTSTIQLREIRITEWQQELLLRISRKIGYVLCAE